MRSIRGWIELAALLLMVSGCAVRNEPSAEFLTRYPPIVFVHGNGDNEGVWQTLAWRYESNGWPADRLFAINLPYPLARDDNAVPQSERSSAEEFTAALKEKVEQVRASTGVSLVVLIGNSRGGYPIRRYVRDTNGATVLAAILCGTPNHGVWAGDYKPGNEANGKGPWLTDLNQPQGPLGLEVTPGVRFLTLRSDGYDKYAQPTGIWLGQPELATHVTADGPALRGAINEVLPKADHRETAFSEASFEAQFRFLTGALPQKHEIVAQDHVTLAGRVSRLTEKQVTNLPLAGAQLKIFPVDAQSGERSSEAIWDHSVGADGRFGPVEALPNVYYEFVIEAPGYAITHVYRSPFLRSSDWIDLRPVQLEARDLDAQSIVMMVRPRGYFGAQRDTMSLDGQPLAGINGPVPGVSSSKIAVTSPSPTAPRTVIAQFNQERIAVLAWPTAQGHFVIAELSD
ncbi:MAG: twin-arginine translocation pathway signal [Burkholderiaceae bacterium]